MGSTSINSTAMVVAGLFVFGCFTIVISKVLKVDTRTAGDALACDWAYDQPVFMMSMVAVTVAIAMVWMFFSNTKCRPRDAPLGL